LKKKAKTAEYFCVCVRRDYEKIWRAVSKHETREAAEAEATERRAYTGSFNYDNAELRVFSRAEAKEIFGEDWEYRPIGEKPSKPKRVT
jgi:hypothetical protein